jgi:hypothetical protein
MPPAARTLFDMLSEALLKRRITALADAARA